MFSAKQTIFAALTVAILSGPAMAEWLSDGPAQWFNLCSIQAEAEGEFVCFTYPTDITAAGATGNFQGYADTGGTNFALIPKGSGVGEYSTMNTADRQVTVTWQGDGAAHVAVLKLQGGRWTTQYDQDVKNPNGRWTIQL
ncbi:uncharacterized protein UTRI_01056_B [Ustilago trichophora]|uniref:Uncharacterized protein n=1 Tax=Ustilago trichophora TaxID=86804 RepID=A0A5C3DVG6_9BASI|nr:uncharacterized protein UTRI_01056_B [Ustilago trichophora]